MTLKNTWVTGETYAATDQNAIATDVNANTAAIAALPPAAAPSAGAVVAASETTASATYVKLATTTDVATVTIGPSKLALVFLEAIFASATINFTTIFVSFSCSGANTLAASDNLSLAVPNSAGLSTIFSGWFLVPLSSTGSTVFDMKYRASGGTMGVQQRGIAVFPL